MGTWKVIKYDTRENYFTERITDMLKASHNDFLDETRIHKIQILIYHESFIIQKQMDDV